MKLKHLWTQHQKFAAPDGLSENFGDNYLLAHNQIYRNIRRLCRQRGFSFSSDPNPLYLALPLSQLDSILSKKVIPYHDNTTVIHQLLDRLPENIFWDDISDNLKGNHAFHEACHAVARSLTQNHYQSDNLRTPSNFQKFTLIRLLEESFANACELLAVIDASDSTHRIFFELNSYICMFEDRTRLKMAMADLGQPFLMMFMMFSYLHANFLTPQLTDQKFEKLLSLIHKNLPTPLTGPQKKTLRSLSKIAFELNLRFRMVTTSLYLRLSGAPVSDKEMMNFDFIQILENVPELWPLLNQLAQIPFTKEVT